MQQTKNKLVDFSTTQLQIFFQHVSLGKEHLKGLLTEQQLNELFKWVNLNEDLKKTIEMTKLEQLGNMSLIINTILTSTFGAWMGLSSCIGCGLGSYKILIIISLCAFFLSGFIGYISSSKTKEQARQSIENQRLLNLQLQILEALVKKHHQKNEEQVYYLNSVVFILQGIDSGKRKLDINFTTSDEAVKWLEQLDTNLKSRLEEVKEHCAYEFYQKKIFQGCYVIKKAINKHIKFLENLSTHKKTNTRQLKIRSTLSFLKILTNPAYANLTPRYCESHRWSDRNFKEIALGLFPTIWGGFASMFVFVGGIPNITRELGYIEWADYLIDPISRTFEILMALIVAAYFGFSYYYSSKKEWQRERLMEQTSNEISELENHLLIYRHKLTTLYTIKNSIQKIISIFSIIKLTDQSNDLNK